jgi:hypothetical protein
LTENDPKKPAPVLVTPEEWQALFERLEERNRIRLEANLAPEDFKTTYAGELGRLAAKTYFRLVLPYLTEADRLIPDYTDGRQRADRRSAPASPSCAGQYLPLCLGRCAAVRRPRAKRFQGLRHHHARGTGGLFRRSRRGRPGDETSALTHDHATGREAAAAWALILHGVFEGKGSPEQAARRLLRRFGSETNAALGVALKAPRDGRAETVERLGGRMGRRRGPGHRALRLPLRARSRTRADDRRYPFRRQRQHRCHRRQPAGSDVPRPGVRPSLGGSGRMRRPDRPTSRQPRGLRGWGDRQGVTEPCRLVTEAPDPSSSNVAPQPRMQ